VDVAVSTSNPLASSLTARRLVKPLVLEWHRRERATSRRSSWIDVAAVHLTFERRDPRLPARARRKCAPGLPVQGRLAGPATTRPRAFRSRGRTASRRPSSHKPVDALWTTRDGATLVGRRKGGAVDRQRSDARDVAAKLARRTTTTEWKAPQAVAQRATPEPPLPSAERATVDSAGYTSGLDAAPARTSPSLPDPGSVSARDRRRARTLPRLRLTSMRINTVSRRPINNHHPLPPPEFKALKAVGLTLIKRGGGESLSSSSSGRKSPPRFAYRG